MVAELRTEQCTSAAIELSKNRYRKQILPRRTIQYKGRNITFDDQYFQDVMTAFQEKAHDQVSFQLATATNAHNNDPNLFRGEIVAFEVDEAGLHGILDLSDEGAALIKNNPRLGVSARLLHGMTRSDGKTFPRAMQHVLGTLDPVITGMSPWEASLSNTGTATGEVLDLSDHEYQSEDDMGDVSKEENPSEAFVLSEEDFNLFQEMKKAFKESENVDKLVEAALAKEDEAADEEVTLSTEADKRFAEQDRRIVELSKANREGQVDREVQAFLNAGLAPAIIDAARPLLMGAEYVDLSNGPDVVRELLTTVMELAKSGNAVIELGVEQGTGQSAPSDTTEADALVSAWSAEYDN